MGYQRRVTWATEGCYSNNYKHGIPNGYTSDGTSCNKVWLPNGAEKNCVALWGDCSGGQKCCGLRIALVILVKRRAFLQLALLLILPLLHLRALKRVNFVKRILIVVKVSASRKRRNAKNRVTQWNC